MICPTLLSDTRFYEALLEFDADLARETRLARCPRCGGVLHSARYPRKPRGAMVALPEGYSTRESLCCSNEDCRRRVTPASVRFLGPKVYLGVVVVLITAMQHGLTHTRASALARAIGASRETLLRWRTWWTDVFVKTPFWSAVRSLFAPPVSVAELPASLLERFADHNLCRRLEKLLLFIRPLSTRSASLTARISMGS